MKDKLLIFFTLLFFVQCGTFKQWKKQKDFKKASQRNLAYWNVFCEKVEEEGIVYTWGKEWINPDYLYLGPDKKNRIWLEKYCSSDSKVIRRQICKEVYSLLWEILEQSSVWELEDGIEYLSPEEQKGYREQNKNPSVLGYYHASMRIFYFCRGGRRHQFRFADDLPKIPPSHRLIKKTIEEIAKLYLEKEANEKEIINKITFLKENIPKVER
jgi:hypothetical protein